jgi:KipI family sensor histidine kinase inhibitor
MIVEDKKFPKIIPVGDSALLIELDEKITPEINARIHSLSFKMQKNPLKGIREWVPGYSSLLLIYDPIESTFDELEVWVGDYLEISLGEIVAFNKEILIPVHYGDENGPDLDFVAAYHHISTEEVVRRHTGGVYTVGMMGFTPGFPYLMGLDPALATPRLDTPRLHVPAGSVGIAGEQTGVYPLESPGGWQIIGGTDKKLFDPENPPHFLLSPGDSVRFVPVSVGNY